MQKTLKKTTPLKPKNQKHQLIKNRIVDTETKRTVQYIYKNIVIDYNKKYSCWWCRLTIEDIPIGCPLESESPTLFHVDGLFCSFNCVKAYIIDQKNDARYSESAKLLAVMYCYINNILEPVIIQPSPPWKFLNEYGGHMTAEQYRQFTGRIIYTERGIVQMKQVVVLYEEDEKF